MEYVGKFFSVIRRTLVFSEPHHVLSNLEIGSVGLVLQEISVYDNTAIDLYVLVGDEVYMAPLGRSIDIDSFFRII